MGGAIAIHLAHDAPPDRMVLAAPFWQFPGLLPELLPLIRLFLPRIHPFRRANFEDPRTVELFNHILPDVDLANPLVQSTIRNEFSIPLRPLEEIVKLGKEAYHKAAQVQCSTLVIQGEQDALVTLKKTRELVNHFPNGNARLEIIESTHDLFADCCIQNDRVYRVIEKFLDDGSTE
jgi:alpha-beta hydrolase superfamily lysophospholipase